MKYTLCSIAFLLLLSTISCQPKTDGDAPGGTTPVVVNPAAPTANSSIATSSKSATGFTLTWPAATDDTTAVALLQYKIVYSTSNNLTDAASAEANGIIALNWTANTLTTTISSLTNSTLYYIAVLVKDVEGNIGLAATTTTTLCVGKRMFLATATDGNLGGKTGADAKCNTQKPVGMGTVKAMLSDNSGINTTTGQPSNLNGRQACYGNCNSSNLYVLDWVIAANQRYCTSDYSTKVGDSGVTYPSLAVPAANALSATPVNFYTGFHIYYGNSTSNCSNWTSTSGSFTGGTTSGIYSGFTTTFITGTTVSNCSSAASIVCVEQ